MHVHNIMHMPYYDNGFQMCMCMCSSSTSPLTSLTVPPFGERRGHFWQLSIVVVVVVVVVVVARVHKSVCTLGSSTVVVACIVQSKVIAYHCTAAGYNVQCKAHIE